MQFAAPPRDGDVPTAIEVHIERVMYCPHRQEMREGCLLLLVSGFLKQKSVGRGPRPRPLHSGRPVVRRGR